MKIEVKQGEQYEEPRIDIYCQNRDGRIEKMIVAINAADGKITLKQEGQAHVIDKDKILYFETVDRRIFAYTTDAVYEMDGKFKDVEYEMREFGFYRISKTVVVNLLHIEQLAPLMNRKFTAKLTNGESVVLSRKYANLIFLLLE